MKVKSFRAPRLVVASLSQGRTVLRGFWFLLCARKLLWLGLFFAMTLAGYAMMPVDLDLLNALHFLHGTREETAQQISRSLSKWGDYPQYNVTLAVLLWIYGALTKNRAWRRAAMICFLAASFAGLFNDIFRFTVGRPRPETHLPDGFYGFTDAMHGTYQSFPSGHAATVFGTAAALLVTDLPLGLITTLYALAVVWGPIGTKPPLPVRHPCRSGHWYFLRLGRRLRREAATTALDYIPAPIPIFTSAIALSTIADGAFAMAALVGFRDVELMTRGAQIIQRIDHVGLARVDIRDENAAGEEDSEGEGNEEMSEVDFHDKMLSRNFSGGKRQNSFSCDFFQPAGESGLLCGFGLSPTIPTCWR